MPRGDLGSCAGTIKAMNLQTCRAAVRRSCMYDACPQAIHLDRGAGLHPSDQPRGPQPGRDGRRLAPTRAARRARDVPRVGRPPEDVVGGLIREGELWAVRLAQQDRPRVDQTPDRGRVLARSGQPAGRIVASPEHN
jgi:hypothetical protein